MPQLCSPRTSAFRERSQGDRLPPGPNPSQRGRKLEKSPEVEKAAETTTAGSGVLKSGPRVKLLLRGLFQGLGLPQSLNPGALRSGSLDVGKAVSVRGERSQSSLLWKGARKLGGKIASLLLYLLPLSQEPAHVLFLLGPCPASFVSLGQKLTHSKSSVNEQMNRRVDPGPWEKTRDEPKRPCWPCWPHGLLPAPFGAEKLLPKSRPKEGVIGGGKVGRSVTSLRPRLGLTVCEELGLLLRLQPALPQAPTSASEHECSPPVMPSKTCTPNTMT
ncbi:hypothetical protein Cadr_000018927 [Camelus dromedarius]|uniref:Uncharacterized protein n=1 Tax=Camelus dromedarius TaxID=9838 RepID=A0A5N4D5X5_CAMDR|nr:hypothetical protein Cadr_000018927 [Camelus dromedarius]